MHTIAPIQERQKIQNRQRGQHPHIYFAQQRLLIDAHLVFCQAAGCGRRGIILIFLLWRNLPSILLSRVRHGLEWPRPRCTLHLGTVIQVLEPKTKMTANLKDKGLNINKSIKDATEEKIKEKEPRARMHLAHRIARHPDRIHVTAPIHKIAGLLSFVTPKKATGKEGIAGRTKL